LGGHATSGGGYLYTLIKNYFEVMMIIALASLPLLFLSREARQPAHQPTAADD
jgi:hypothetical protein